MTSFDPWRRVEELYEAASDMPAQDREEWLERACAGDGWLRKEVEKLLGEEPEDSAKIAGIIEDAAVGLFDEDAAVDAMAGEELGHYRILRELGRGGMGAVYLAVRSDEAFDKQVAIKLVKRGIDTEAVLERFRYERRILAALEHPYIARLLDGGTSPDGRPYFVMEYVDGKPLDGYAREEKLSLRQRCELMRKVCEAVAYAHRNLVIHRDLKPANILIAGDGTPRLLDFGIARLLSIDPEEQTLTGTMKTRALTPEFASPEQLRGEAVTTATDVYSLGATLKAILPEEGETPFELATILGKAMREEIEQRYATAADFSEDLRRYLEGLPIRAREQTLLYRAGKFVRRHRAGVLAFGLAGVAAVAGMAAIVWESREARVERERAEQRLSQAVDVAERALADVNNSIASLPGATEARRQMVRNTIEYLDRLAKDSGNDPRVLIALATAYVRVGEVLGNVNFSNLGDLPGSLATYRKAMGLIDGPLKKIAQETKIQDLAAVAHQGTGSVLEMMGRSKLAEDEYRMASTAADNNLSRDPNNLGLQERSLDAHYALHFLDYMHDPKGAEADITKQLELAERMAKAYPRELPKQETLSEFYSLLGIVLDAENRLLESIDCYRKAVAIREEIYRQEPLNTRYQRNLMIGYGHMGDSLGNPLVVNLGDYQGALVYYRKAEGMIEEMVRLDPSDKRAALDLGMVWTRIGMTSRAAGDLNSSIQFLDRAIAQFEAMMKSAPNVAAYQGGILLAYDYRGRNMRQLGDFPAALEWERKCMDFAAKLLAQGRTDKTTRTWHVVAMEQIAGLRALMGDSAGAEKIASRALAEAQDNFAHGGNRISLASSWFRNGLTHEVLHDCQAARPAYSKAVEIWKQETRITAWSEGMLHAAEQGAAHCGSGNGARNLRNQP